MRKYWLGIGIGLMGLLSPSTTWGTPPDTITGDFLVTGNSALQGGLSVGADTATSTPGLIVEFVNDPTTPQITFNAPSAITSWSWSYLDGASTGLAMSLDKNNILTLFSRTTPQTDAIVLDPEGMSTFADSLTVNGTDNRMPNQTLLDGSSVLTQELANGLYLSSADISATVITDPTLGTGIAFALPGGTATGFDSEANIGATANSPFAVALGIDSFASATGAVSVGYGSAAGGFHAVAVGPESSATGGSAISLGASSSALGDYSATLGAFSTASGFGAFALGYDSTASGDYAAALGEQTVAQGSNQLVAGRFNDPQGTGTGWVDTDDLFQLGNGSDAEHLSNAFTVKKNGDTSVAGDLAVEGNASTGGNQTVTGNLTVTGNINVTGGITGGGHIGGMHVFTTSGTFTVPAGVTTVDVEVVGGGGGSGGAAADGTDIIPSSGNGGGGGYSRKIISGLTSGASIAVTVGAGGIAGTTDGADATSAGSGGTSSFGSYFGATGGVGSVGASGNVQTSNGAGGGGVSGDLNINGNPSGASMLSTGPSPGSSAPGTSYGGGATGASPGPSGSANGAAGAPGIVIVRW